MVTNIAETIKEIEKKWLFRSTDYELTKMKKDTSELVSFDIFNSNNLSEKQKIKLENLYKC